ncbi:MAG: 2-oxo acid dehydrogenase subunit E2 [Christensenella sp.]|nr:2-oxo acid dehydrogenase subunit E2 [Christensenella sp.]
MAQRVIIPRMGQTMTEGVVARWYVKDGDSVATGDDIYELEYDKSTATVQAKSAGTVRLLCEEGATIPLGEAVAVILADGETLESVNVKGEYGVANAAQTEKETVAPARETAEKTEEAGTTAFLATPLVKRLAREMGIDLKLVNSGREDGRITKEDLFAYEKLQKEQPGQAVGLVHDCENCHKCPEVKVSPLARKVAQTEGIDTAEITPADGRRITKRDVLARAQSKPQESLPQRGEHREKMSGMRKSISKHMSQSYFMYPTVTLTTDADMFELLKLRTQLNEELASEGIKLSITDMLVKAVAKALVRNKIVNTSLEGDEIVYHDAANVGMAVALDNGLVVPVIHDADMLSLEEISVEAKRVVAMAKSGQLGAEQMAGGTFTLTNLGTMGIDSFNPIINIPQSAILGVGRVVEKPVVLNGEVVVRPKMVLSITHDHRVIDGVPAAKFLQDVVRFIEKPFLLLMN